MHCESWPPVCGREAIVKASSAEQLFEGLHHSISNMQVEFDGTDKATGRACPWYVATPAKARSTVN